MAHEREVHEVALGAPPAGKVDRPARAPEQVESGFPPVESEQPQSVEAGEKLADNVELF